MSRDEATLLDLAEALRLIRSFRAEVEGRADFKRNKLVQSAILHQILVLGEAVKRLSGAFKARHDHIPWKAAARMRDRVIHGYDTVDLDVVWDTVTLDIPLLHDQLRPLLPSEK